MDKKFSTEKELKEAEAEKAEAETKKAEAKALIKKDSDVVNNAFVVRNNARKDYNTKVVEARRTYNEAVKAAQEAFNASLEEVTEAKKKAEDDFNAKLHEFCKAHPENYRLVLKDGDEAVTYINETKFSTDWFDDFDKMFDAIRNFRLW